MRPVADFGRYLWRFFVGDVYQLVALAVAFGIVWALHAPLRAWDGLLAFVLVAVVMGTDVSTRARRQAQAQRADGATAGGAAPAKASR